MWRSEGGAPHQATGGQPHPRRRVHHGCLQRHIGLERRQQPWDALRQHRLPRTRRPDEQHVVAPGRRDLQPQPSQRLAADVGKIRGWRLVVDVLLVGRLRPRGLGIERIDHFPQGARHTHTIAGDTLRLTEVAQRHHRAHLTHRRHHGSNAGDLAHAAIEPELTDEAQPLQLANGHLPVGGEEPDGDGEIEPGAALALAGRRQVDRDPARRPLQLAGEHGSTDPIARLSARFIGQADDLERGQPCGHVHFNGDRAPLDAEHRGRANSSEHARLLRRTGGADAPTNEGGNGDRFPDGYTSQHIGRPVDDNLLRPR